MLWSRIAVGPYLLSQPTTHSYHRFIKDNVNDRTDEYGGSIENRCRFALEVTEAVVAAVGADRVGIRLSPFTNFLDVADSTPYGTNVYLLEQLNKFGLAYVHMVEPRMAGGCQRVCVSASVRVCVCVCVCVFVCAQCNMHVCAAPCRGVRAGLRTED